MNDCNESKPGRHPPDPILAELWEIKKQINQEAGYQIPKLVEMAHTAAVNAGQFVPDVLPTASVIRVTNPRKGP